MAVTINASTSTGLVQSADTSGEIELQSNGTTALKVNTNEGIQILNCLGVGNATPSTSGAGITFPATQSASTDANTLDDYEEGTFNVSITSASGTITMDGTLRVGAYTKVGRLVTVTGNVALSGSSASGTITFGGLPFAVDSGITANAERYAGGVFLNGWGTGDGYGAVLVDSGTSGILYTSTRGTPVADASQEVYFSFFYFTS